MRFLAAIIIVLIGIALAIKLDTGTLSAVQVTGIGFIIVGIAFFLPPTWPNWPAA